MALHRHDDADHGEPVDSAANCVPCGPAEGRTRRRVLLFVCAASESKCDFARTLADVVARKTRAFHVEVHSLTSLEAAQNLSRGDFSGDDDRVIVVIDFDTAKPEQLAIAQELVKSHPVRAFFMTDAGQEAQLRFIRAGNAIGSVVTIDLRGVCLLKQFYRMFDDLVEQK